jgi:hypothetical protein
LSGNNERTELESDAGIIIKSNNAGGLQNKHA